MVALRLTFEVEEKYCDSINTSKIVKRSVIDCATVKLLITIKITPYLRF